MSQISRPCCNPALKIFGEAGGAGNRHIHVRISEDLAPHFDPRLEYIFQAVFLRLKKRKERGGERFRALQV